jgi:hypothetical protein
LIWFGVAREGGAAWRGIWNLEVVGGIGFVHMYKSESPFLPFSVSLPPPRSPSASLKGGGGKQRGPAAGQEGGEGIKWAFHKPALRSP